MRLVPTHHRCYTKSKNGSSDEEKLEARNTLLLYNQRFVFSIAKRYTYSGCLTLEDLIQEGTIGLIKAIDHFDVSKGHKFSTYAIWWVRRTIARATEDTADTIRKPGNVLDLYKRLLKVGEEIKRFAGIEPTYEDLAEASGVSIKRVKEILLSMQMITSVDGPLFPDGEDDDETILSNLPDGRATPVDIVSERVFNEQLEALIGSSLDVREAEVIKRRLGLFGYEEHTLGAIGEVLGEVSGYV